MTDSKPNKRKLLHLPQTYFGFPVSESFDELDQAETKQPFKNAKKQGLALLIGIMIIAVLMVFASDLILSSQVNLELTHQQTNNLKAEYLAKSGGNLAIFLLAIDYGIDLYMEQTAQQKPTDSLGDIWSLVNGMPIGGETEELIKGFADQMNLSSNLDSGVLERLKDFPGQFVINIQDESKKINLNQCTNGRCLEVLGMLEALFSCPAEKKYLEEKEIKPEELVANIKDWVDRNTQVEKGSIYSDEDAPYSKEEPPYGVKQAPFYSVDELKMVAGWDDELHAIFSPYITVYPFKKDNNEVHEINLNTIDRSLLACLIPEANNDCGEKFAQTMHNRNRDKTAIADSASIKEILKSVMCLQSNEQGEKKKGKSDWFAARSKAYTIEVTGLVEDQEKVLKMVIQRKVPDVKSKFDFEDSTASYEILYWKLI